jgi:hypothetical protein
MSFRAVDYQPQDIDWLLSKAAYNSLCHAAAQEGRSRPATARRMLNRFFKLAKATDYDLSRLHFDMANEPLSVPTTFGVILRKGEVDRVCLAGRFGPDMLLEVALSCMGLKEAVS